MAVTQIRAVEKKKFEFPTAYTVLLSLMIIIALATQIVPGVKQATLADVVMAPVTGMVGLKDNELNDLVTTTMETEGVDAALQVINEGGKIIDVWNTGSLKGAIDVALFVLIIGGFLGVVTKTGALDAGVGAIVKKLKGKELLLIPVLMVMFSFGGTAYGMAEETLAFYALITATMIAAGFDSMVAVGTVLLGAGCGVLGSTVNPFAVGAAISAADAAGVEINQGMVIALGVVLWAVSLTISIMYVMNYAKKVQKDEGKSVLTRAELNASKEAFKNSNEEILELNTSRMVVLGLFVFSFTVMIMGVIPWNDFGVTIFDETTTWLNGSPLGAWWFPELTVWFFIMAVIIGVVYRLAEKDIVSSFISGAADMVGVALVIGISRGISFMMTNSGLDIYILDQAAGVLSGVSEMLFTNMAYIIYLPLAFLIPSTSGLASVSMPIFAPLAQTLEIAPELIVSAFTAGSGLINLFTPTSGVVMGGLTIAKVDYTTWIKFATKVILMIFVATIVVLSVAPMFLGL